ncbi:MAG TPA: MOSC N-terminal beta barrel domain-containing protein [Candidatus Didemnitutus sp.]|nr:MOSC N-terminal beta barrel domain-containing protein [Candidatus Didemnitutus sp.]
MNLLVRECYLYPVKACAGVRVDELAFDAAGQIIGDREWVIVDERGIMTWLGAIPKLALIRPQLTANGWSLLSPSDGVVLLPPAGQGALCTVQAWNGDRQAFESLAGRDSGDGPAAFVSDVVGKKVRVVWLATHQHLPNPIHLTTVPSLRNLAAQLGVSVESVSFHRRFRLNLLLDAVPGESLSAFAEEAVKTLTRKSNPLPLTLDVTGKCTRCIVIDVDPEAGHTDERYFAGTRKHSAHRHPGKEAYFGIYARARSTGRLAAGDILAAEMRS